MTTLKELQGRAKENPPVNHRAGFSNEVALCDPYHSEASEPLSRSDSRLHNPMTVILRAYSILLPPHARETPAAVGSTIALMTAGLPLSKAR